MNRRDIELLISAKDATGRTFPQVAASVTALTSTIDEQARASENGEVKLRDLQKTQKELGAVGEELSSLQGLIEVYNRLVAAREKLDAQLVGAQAKQATLTAEIAKSGTATTGQETRLAGLETRIASYTSRLNENRLATEAQAASLGRAGISVDTLAVGQQRLVEAARSTGQALVTARGAIDGFDADLFRTASNARAAGASISSAIDLTPTNTMLKVNQSFLKTFRDELALTERQTAASALALENFQQIGRQAVATARTTSPTAPTEGDGGDRVAAGLRAIIQPGEEAIRTLEGVDAAIEKAASVADTAKLRVAQYSSALNDLREVGAAIVKTGALIDTFQAQVEAVDQAKAAFESAREDVVTYGSAVASAVEPNQELKTKLEQAERALTSTTRALSAEEAKLASLRPKLKAAGVDTENLAGAQAKLEEQATATAESQEKLEETLGTNGEPTGALFGLNPFDLQNLGFQVNDVFTQLASGTGILQTLAQQGGQIIQIFPGAISALAGLAGPVLAIVAPVALLVTLFAALKERADAVERFSDALNANVDGSLYDPKNLESISEGIQNLGVSAEDAEASILSFVNAGLDPSAIEQYARAAADMSAVLGNTVPEATDLLVAGLSAGYDAVVELDEQTNVLTESERVYAKELFDTGRAAEARQFVFDRVTTRMGELAASTRGPWTTAAVNFKTAWTNLLDTLGQRGFIEEATQDIENLGVAVAFLGGLLAGKGIQASADEAISTTKANRDALAAIQARGRARQDDSNKQAKADRDYLDNIREQGVEVKKLTKAERILFERRRAAREASEAGLSQAAVSEAANLAEQFTRRTIAEEEVAAAKKGDKAAGAAARKAEAARRKAEAAAKRSENEARAAAARIKAAQDQLRNQFREIDAKVGRGETASLESRLGAIDLQYAKIFDSIDALQNLGVRTTSDGLSLDAARAKVEAAKEALKQETRLAEAEERVNRLTKQRADTIKDIVEDQKDGAITAAEAFERAAASNAEISPQIVQAAQDALLVARAMAGIKPNAAMTELIARLERVTGAETAENPLTTPQADVGRGALANEERKLNDLISERNDLVAAYNVLVQLGAMTEDEARTAAAAAYAATTPAILEQANAVMAIIELLRQQKIITQEAYDLWIAKIEAVKVGTQQIDPRLLQLQESARQAIVNGVANAFDVATAAIGGLIDGSKSLGDVLNDIFGSAISLVAGFAKAVAQAIIQVIALNLAKKLIGNSFGAGLDIFHTGGKVGTVGGRTRSGVSPMAFLAAPRFHGGANLGLKSDEYAAILQRNEVVLTEEQARKKAAGGQGAPGGQAPRVDVKVVNQLDSADIVEAGLQSRSGQRVLINALRSNKSAVQEAIR